jgi:hypothetical protein
VLSDLHSGSLLSPLCPHFETSNGQILEPNDWQREMYEAIEYLAKMWHKPNKLILLGDMYNNPERGDSALGVWNANPLDWTENVVRMIKLFDAEKIYVLRGTGRHVMIGDKAPVPGEEYLARELKAEKIGPGKYRSAIKYMPDKWGFRFHFAHHTPSSQTEWFLTTPLAKEGIRLQLQHSRLGHVDAIFRGHNHYWDHIEFRSQHLISCPCFQLPTEYMYKKSGEPLTDIGAVRFRLTEKPDDFGERFRVQKSLFPILAGDTVKSKW